MPLPCAASLALNNKIRVANNQANTPTTIGTPWWTREIRSAYRNYYNRNPDDGEAVWDFKTKL